MWNLWCTHWSILVKCACWVNLENFKFWSLNLSLNQLSWLVDCLLCSISLREIASCIPCGGLSQMLLSNRSARHVYVCMLNVANELYEFVKITTVICRRFGNCCRSLRNSFCSLPPWTARHRYEEVITRYCFNLCVYSQMLKYCCSGKSDCDLQRRGRGDKEPFVHDDWGARAGRLPAGHPDCHSTTAAVTAYCRTPWLWCKCLSVGTDVV